ncbi:UNVERIFIED_CONTAM: hypothetical protein GTU68_022299 [Idotea baltica]|nr:hypothetical protein [Idotea baltica]
MPCSKSRYCIRVVVDVTLLFIVVTAIFLVKKLWSPFDRGMYCHDISLLLPFKDNDTISDTLLLFYGVAIPFIVICLVEFLRAGKQSIGKDFGMANRRVSSWMWSVYSTVGVFLFGCACTQLSTDIAKYSLGYLRPHFIDVCKPDFSGTNCTLNPLQYIDPIPCTTDDASKLKDARLSFPSGHASFSTFTMLYLVVYLQARLRINGFRLIRPTFQLICLLMNFYTCLSRISDYKHHWSDVVGGYILGATIAILVTLFVAELFPSLAKPTQAPTKNASVMLQDYHQTPDEPPLTNSHSP